MSNIIVDTVRQVARLAPPKTIKLSIPDTDNVGAMLWITYDLMTETKPTGFAMADTTMYSRPADTYHYINELHAPEFWQDILSVAGWTLGGGYMYRWHFAPGREHNHLWGLERYDLGDGDVTATGDENYGLAELCRQFGVWQWEINSAWQRGNKIIKWRAEDPRRDADGLRVSAFPGWAGDHPFRRATGDGTGYESRYYYVRPQKYNSGTDILVK